MMADFGYNYNYYWYWYFYIMSIYLGSKLMIDNFNLLILYNPVFGKGRREENQAPMPSAKLAWFPCSLQLDLRNSTAFLSLSLFNMVYHCLTSVIFKLH